MNYQSEHEEVGFTVECKMNRRWARQFIGMLKRMQQLGAVGSSREVIFYSDGDGDYRPRFEFKLDYTAAKGQGKEELFFDAG